MKFSILGGDEYANDVDTGGWAKLQSSGRYKDFVAYANDLAKIIKDAGMQPISSMMAFITTATILSVHLTQRLLFLIGQPVGVGMT